MDNKKLSVVNTRLLTDADLSNKARKASFHDVAFFMAKEVNRYKSECLGILNMDVQGRVINFNIGTVKTMEKHFQELMTNVITSNASSFILVSNMPVNEKAKNLTMKFGDAAHTLSTMLIDHIQFDKNTGNYVSYVASGIETMSAAALNDQIEIEAGRKKDIKWLTNRLGLKKEGDLKSDKEITRDEAINLVAEELRYLDKENLYVISLDEDGKPINCNRVATGTLCAAPAEPREILKAPILSNAKSIVLLHNHPSGSAIPSDGDKEATQRTMDSANLVGIELDDHIIVGAINGARHSMKETGELEDIKKNNQMLVKVNYPDFDPEPLRESKVFEALSNRSLDNSFSKDTIC